MLTLTRREEAILARAHIAVLRAWNRMDSLEGIQAETRRLLLRSLRRREVAYTPRNRKAGHGRHS